MGKPAARIGDAVAHPRAPNGVIISAASTVMIGGQFAARVSDRATHGRGQEAIVEGESTVLIEGLPAARMGDKVACGGLIIGGCGTVLIGKDRNQACLQTAADEGATVVAPDGD